MTPSPRHDGAAPKSAAKPFSLKRISYLVSIILAFILPGIKLLQMQWNRIPKKPFFLSFIIIGVLGWIWSWIVSSNVWWSFGEDYLLGVDIIPHLPLEELLFYPFGGGLCILFYVVGARIKNWTQPTLYWAFIIVGSIVFIIIAWVARDQKPYYLYSQLVLYNLICTFLLAPFVAKQMNLLGLAFPIAILSIVGFVWDYIGFKYGWWAYHAIAHFYISIVPIEDFNFFLFAPSSAVSIYLGLCRVFKTKPVLP